jgi:acyl carrier protein
VAPGRDNRVLDTDDLTIRLGVYVTATLMSPGEAEALGEDEPLLGRGILDSPGIMRLVAFIEEEFDVEVPDTALVPEHFGTLRRLAAFVRRLETPSAVLRQP